MKWKQELGIQSWIAKLCFAISKKCKMETTLGHNILIGDS